MLCTVFKSSNERSIKFIIYLGLPKIVINIFIWMERNSNSRPFMALCLHPNFKFQLFVPLSIVRERVGVNFTNVLHTAFIYVSCVHSFFVLTFQVCTLPAQDCWRKSCMQNVDEIQPRRGKWTDDPSFLLLSLFSVADRMV